jgi:hypothetical protein
MAWAVEYDGETITLHNSFAKAKDYARFTRQDGIQGRVVPLYRSPPPVAVPAEQRHDPATCCGERQDPAKPVEIDGDKPDVGDGWRELGADEILQPGDEADVGQNEATWVATVCIGKRVGDMYDRYRRRVTPDVPAAGPQDFERWSK